MSRFSNLEFGGQREEQPRRQQSQLKDEAYYLAEAQAAYERGDFEAGLRAYAKAVEFNPHHPAAWAGQVRMLIELGEFDEAKVWADKALEEFPLDAELLAAKAVALARLGDLKAALTFSDAAIDEKGDSPYVWLARGDVLLARRERRADFCFEQALAREPQNWVWHWLASRVYYYYRKFARALKLAQQSLALDAGHVVVWLQLGLCQRAIGLANQAEISFAQARELDPACHEAQAALTALSHRGIFSRLYALWCQVFRS
jgi:tetratricopeptide (TPR) repeat protein